MIRNLVYYVFPIRGSIWNWNVDKVLKYWDGFTGRKIICITTDEATEKAETVKDKFASHGAEFLIDQNDPRLCETKTFIPALSLLESQRGDEITFYAHAKGVTRSGEVLTHVQSWADGMYEVNLRYLDVIDRILSKYSSAGCFLHESVNHAWSDWHYSGTFFWFKHSALFSKNWKKIYPSQFGVEGYIGQHIPRRGAYSLTPSGDNYYVRSLPSSDVEVWLEKTKKDWLS